MSEGRKTQNNALQLKKKNKKKITFFPVILKVLKTEVN